MKRGWRLSTKLISTYALVALIAVVVAGAVALPLLQSYQDAREEEEYQRNVLVNTGKLELLRSQLLLPQSDRNRNPFSENLATNRTAPITSRVWPAAPSLDTVRQKFTDLAQERGFRLLVISEREREVRVDTGADASQSLQGQVLTPVRVAQSTPGGTPLTAGGQATLPQIQVPMQVSAANGQQLDIIYRRMNSDNLPNLFGVNQRQQPLSYGLALVMLPPASRDAWRELLPILLLAFLVALVASFVAGLLLARSLSRPLVRLTEATQAVARGDYSQRVPLEGGEELGRLSQSFNQMTGAVADAQRMQRQLIADVSHELKTPLTSIQGFAQAMQDGVLRRPEDFAGPASIISRETARMIRLVNSLLDLSKLESGQAALKRQEIELAGILKSCVDTFVPRAQELQVDLLAEFSPPLILLGDPDRIQQVFYNLIDNALKYTPPGGYVRVNAILQETNIVVGVTDTGSGIPPVDLPHLFERFYQSDKSRRRDLSTEGTGLGLAICKEIIQAHGGKIAVSSVEGLGTQFSVTLVSVVNKAPTDKPLAGSLNPANVQLVNKN